MKRLVGIYCIRNKINDCIYIGSSVNINGRIYDHFKYLGLNCHDNGHLQNAFNKYGRDNFEYEIALLCDRDMLSYFEQHYGVKFSEEHIRKLVESRKITMLERKANALEI